MTVSSRSAATRWPPPLPEDLPFYAFQSLGLDGSDEPLATVEQMAEFYLREMRRVQPEGPYYLTGSSLGGLVAIEMARRLLAGRERIGLLALLHTECPVASPHLPPRSWLFDRRMITWLFIAVH